MGHRVSTSRYKRVYELTNLLQTKRFANPQVKDYPRILGVINDTVFYKFSGNAMIPTLEDSETLLEVRRRKSLHDVHLGDVIALVHPKSPNEVLIRRLTAKENDELISTEGIEPMKVPPGKIWVTCDNLNVTSDSREYGPLSSDAVLGRVISTLNASYTPTGVVINSAAGMLEDANAQLVTTDLLQAYIKQIVSIIPFIQKMQAMENKSKNNDDNDKKDS